MLTCRYDMNMNMLYDVRNAKQKTLRGNFSAHSQSRIHTRARKDFVSQATHENAPGSRRSVVRSMVRSARSDMRLLKMS